MTLEHFDVLIIGAGLSGIGAAFHLQRHCPARTYAILEGRAAIGGTWDLFRYPGVRSDSDMYTLGYSFRPWQEAKAIADGPSILNYVRATARESGIDGKVRFGHQVKSASWSSADARWTVTTERAGNNDTVRITCHFLFMCAGYYSYKGGYEPAFPGRERFAGPIIHPQQWPANIDYAGKRVVVIGSGATAVTLVPAMAERAAHVTMLQRSPTYVVARPSVDHVADKLRRWLPAKLAYSLVRWKNVLWGMFVYNRCMTRPQRMKRFIIGMVRQQLGPDYDVATHFTPRYNPWNQRLCLVPDADLFEAIKGARAAVVTDTIDTFTETGIRLASGNELAADLIVTATGLQLEVLGGLAVTVDGERIDFSRAMTYKGMMYAGVPNLASAFGYTNASWTLKADLTCEYVCRLLNHMDKTGAKQCTPRLNDPAVLPQPWVNFSSGYFQRSIDRLPKQGSKRPWKLYQNYALDLMTLKFGSVTDSAMEFSGK